MALSWLSLANQTPVYWTRSHAIARFYECYYSNLKSSLMLGHTSILGSVQFHVNTMRTMMLIVGYVSTEQHMCFGRVCLFWDHIIYQKWLKSRWPRLSEWTGTQFSTMHRVDLGLVCAGSTHKTLTLKSHATPPNMHLKDMFTLPLNANVKVKLFAYLISAEKWCFAVVVRCKQWVLASSLAKPQ